MYIDVDSDNADNFHPVKEVEFFFFFFMCSGVPCLIFNRVRKLFVDSSSPPVTPLQQVTMDTGCTPRNDPVGGKSTSRSRENSYCTVFAASTCLFVRDQGRTYLESQGTLSVYLFVRWSELTLPVP